METLSSFHVHQFNPSLLPNSLRNQSWACLTLRVAESSAQTSQNTTLSSLNMIHAQIIKSPDNGKSEEDLIQQYAQVGDARSTALLLLLGLSRNHSRQSSLFEEFKRHRTLSLEVLEVFRDLHSKGIIFDHSIFIYVLMVSSYVSDMLLGVEVHACLVKRGFIFDPGVHCALMKFYERCWDVDCANRLFDEMSEKYDLVWNETIKLNLRNGRWMRAFELFRCMQLSPEKVKNTAVVKLLQACGKLKALKEGKQIHGYVLRYGLESDVSIGNSIISMYAKNGELDLAIKTFDSMKDRTLTSWNSIISAHASLGDFNDAWDCLTELESSDLKPDIITWNCLLSGLVNNGLYETVLTIFRKMQIEGFQPNSSSVTCALQSIIEMSLLNSGKEIHSYVIKHSFDYDVYVGSSLVDMYVKSDNLSAAQSVFISMKSRNIFAWNSLISGYSFKGLFEDAENLLNQMTGAGVKPDLVTWNSLLFGYSMLGHSKKAVSIIDEIKRSGLVPNVVSWTALISGCSQNGSYREAFEFFIKMQGEGVKPNAATISCLLQICGGLSLLQKGKEIHCFVIKNGMMRDIYVTTAAIDMYCKSGNLRSAVEVFRWMRHKPLATWNCMIMGFATYGCGKEAILQFQEMCSKGITPDAITFTAVLSGCKNSGLVNEGWFFFDSMSRDHSITPTIEHYCCMVDLLGRAGYLDEAWDFIQSMPLKPDATIWGALLCSSIIHKNLYYAEIASKHLFELEPHNSANYVLMMNLYSMLNRWEDVGHVKDLMSSYQVKSGKAWSWIQIDNTVHYFSSEQNQHADAGEIYFELYQLVSEIRKLGYVPDTNCVYQNVDEKEKEKMLLTHTEKMATAYGLIKTRSQAPIRVIKNSRVCSDCHTAMKYISLARNREILIKDGVRFHHFSEGGMLLQGLLVGFKEVKGKDKQWGMPVEY